MHIDRCKQILKSVRAELNPIQKNIREAWSSENFSNPKTHSPTKFRYLVHAVRSSKAIEQTAQKLAENPYISTSLIDESHGAVLHNSGFILEPNPDHLLASSPEDMALQLTTETKVLDAAGQLGENPVKSPEQILANTGKSRRAPHQDDSFYDDHPSLSDSKFDYIYDDFDIGENIPLAGEEVSNINEILYAGHSSRGRPVKFLGAFYTVDQKGRPNISKARMKELEDFCLHQGLAPPVAIPERPLFVGVTLEKD